MIIDRYIGDKIVYVCVNKSCDKYRKGIVDGQETESTIKEKTE